MKDPAVQALAVAYSFITDCVAMMERVAHSDNFPQYAPEALNTISLAAKQIQVAEKLNPNAVLSIELPDGTDHEFSIPHLKAVLLAQEGMVHVQSGNYKKAVPILETATTLDPVNPHCWHWLGLAHGHQLNKGPAINAYEKAIELAPDNLEYRKNLERIKNISGGQIAFDRTATVANTGYGIVTIFFMLVTLGLFATWIYNFTRFQQDPGSSFIIFIGIPIFWIIVIAPVWTLMNKMKSWFS